MMSTSALHPQQQDQQHPPVHPQYQLQHRASAADLSEGLTVHSDLGDDIRVNAIAPSASSTTLRRGPWAPEEDRKLIESINLFGPTNWVRISQSLGTRTPKQCRERYHQNLKPSLNRNPISPEEGQLIEELVAKYGKRWAEIARHLNGRSDNAIKNWWNGGTNRRRRASSQAILSDPQHDSQHIQPLSEYNPHQQQQQHPPPPPHAVHYQPPTGPHAVQPQYVPQYLPPQHQPAFNTAIFQSQPPQHAVHVHAPPPLGMTQQQVQPQASTQQRLPGPSQLPLSLPPHQPLPPTHTLQHSTSQQQILPPLNSSRPSSITQEMFTQHTGVKRFLEEQHQPARRHSTQTILTSTGGSSSPFSRGGSSRNSSISFDWNQSTALNSQSNSRRSSLAHELFPNPLGTQSKRQNSYSSAYLSPNIQSQRGSTSGIVPLHMTMTPPSSVAAASQPPQNMEKPLFKSEFSFNKEGVKLPPPSSIPSNPAFTPSAMLNRGHLPSLAPMEQKRDILQPLAPEAIEAPAFATVDKVVEIEGGNVTGGKGTEDAQEGEKSVMNISNLLG